MTPSVRLEIGVYQGDPLSVVIFLTVMATLSDTLSTRHDLGVVIPNLELSVHHLLYADDTCIVSSSPAACQHLLDIVQQWLDWAQLKAKPSKSRALSIKASTGKAGVPNLSIGGEKIPGIGDSHFVFLGMPIHVPPNPKESQGVVQASLERMLVAIDKAPITCHQRLRLYKQGICPRLSWPFLISDFSISFLERVLQPMATRFLKKWSGLARPANPSLLFLPPRKGGLGLPTLTGLYKKQQSALKVQLLLSHDHSVRAIAKHQLCLETANNRQKFRPSETAQLVMDAHPGVHRKVLMKSTKVLNPRRCIMRVYTREYACAYTRNTY